MTESAITPIPVVCDMTTAVDTTDERLADYKRLFESALIGREHTDRGIQFRFAADHGVDELVRDLAEREHACCAFMFFEVTTTDDEIWEDVWVTNDDTARVILDEYYQLPETLSEDVAGLFARFASRGLEIVIDDNRTIRQASADDLAPVWHSPSMALLQRHNRTQTSAGFSPHTAASSWPARCCGAWPSTVSARTASTSSGRPSVWLG